MKVSLQFPEGLLLHSTLLADIIGKFCGVETLILGDVTYGACCVDDIASKQLECDFIVHYGHSCLVAIPDLVIQNALYVFVEIKFDVEVFVESIAHNFPERKDQPLFLMGIIQFNNSLLLTKALLEKQRGFSRVFLPQCKPRSKGEVLGCTSPVLDEARPGDVVVFIGDGRFHIESSMIRNPELRFFQFNPYTLKFTREVYQTEKMKAIRKAEVDKAKSARVFGVILGTLGRQGSTTILEEIQALIERNNREYFVLFLSEITPQKLQRFEDEVDAWVQIACPRLSIDWGHFCSRPLLNTYEAFACLNEIEWLPNYPMDYYSDKGGRWSNYFRRNQEAQERKAKKGLLKKNRDQIEESKQIKIEYE